MEPMAERVVCLGAGAVTGGAWQLGVVWGLAEEGIDLACADRIIGTSAGALIGAHLALGRAPQQTAELLLELPVSGRMVRPATLARLGAAQVWPSRRHALTWLGRAALRGGWSPELGQEWVACLGEGLTGAPWPAPLVVVAVDALSGRPAYFTATSGVPLEQAVAATCALPGVFPPVLIEGRPHFDGALRSLVNLDLAVGASSVVAVAPFTGSARPHRRPSEQAKLLTGSRVAVLQPDRAARRVMGLDPVLTTRSGAALTAGREFGKRHAEAVRQVWQAPSSAAHP